MLRNQLSADCDNQCKNIILQGLPPEVYALVSNHKVTKELWERIQLLMQVNSHDENRKEMKAYDEFDKFAYKESGNTTKFVTDVKLVQDLHTTNIDQLHAYLGQHEFHANEVDYPIDAIQSHDAFLTAVKWDARGLRIKCLLVQAQANGQILHEDKLAFLADPRIAEGQATQTVINHNVSYQAGDLDVYDSDYDELNTAKLALIANLSHYETEITSDSNIIPYSQYVIELQQAAVQNSNSSAQQDALIFLDQSTQTVHILTKPQFFYDHTTKQALCFQNPFYLKKAQQLEPKLYDGNVIKNMSAIVIPDSEETLMLAEESHSKMLLKQKDPMMLENKVNTKPVDYDNSVTSLDPTLSSRPTKVEVPKELPKVSMVNTINLKSVEISDLNASLQEKVLVIIALKDDLKKLKEKALVDNLLQTQLDTEDAY
ncbi:hypothetical protein Tco_0092526 [Tanacetum coccineum]